MKEKPHGRHPTQKPLRLLRRAVLGKIRAIGVERYGVGIDTL
jgi:hypothetical protein